MKRIEAYIRVSKLEAVKSAIEDAGFSGLTVEQVRGYGRQQGMHDKFSGSEYALNLVPKMKLDVVVPDDRLEPVLEAICAAAETGEMGDGKIFISEVEDAIRIRTGERGESALL